MIDGGSYYLLPTKGKKLNKCQRKKEASKHCNCCGYRFIMEHRGETLKNEAINNKALDEVDDCLVSDPSLTSFFQPPETSETHPHVACFLLFRKPTQTHANPR